MKLETILDVSIMVARDIDSYNLWDPQPIDFIDKRRRQLAAFRARILRMFEKKDIEINNMRARLFSGIHQSCADKRKTKYVYPHIYCSLCGKPFTHFYRTREGD